MDENRNDAVADQCHPRRLTEKLETFLSKHNLTTPTKRRRVLAWLVCASEEGCKVTRFDAETIGCHCLNTSISEIGRYDGIKVSRNQTKRPTRFEKPTNCKEYWLEPEMVNKARTFLGVRL